MIINFVTEFLFWKFVVYKGSENTNARALKEQQIKEQFQNKEIENKEENNNEKTKN